MDASCGPSNALQNLSKHTQRDNSLQNEFMGRNAPQQPGQGFRSNVHHVDQNLNQEFQQFNGAHQVNNAYMNQISTSHNFNHIQRQPQQKQQPGWVQDFSNLSINHRQTPQHHQPTQRDWHQQFMSQQGAQQHQQQHQQQPTQYNQRAMPNYTAGFSMNMRTNLSNPVYNQMGTPTEHQEVHNLEQERLMFDDQFDQLEKELAAQELEQPEVVQQEADVQIPLDDNELEKEEFANTARKVHQSMTKSDGTRSTETNSKFEQSDFLKLMNSISNRSVELSHEGDKLVNKAGEDIREHLSDPLREVKNEQLQNHPEPSSEVNYHQPMHEASPFPPYRSQMVRPAPVESHQPELRGHLPDPLAHIKDGVLGDIDSPLQAAQIISGGQVNANDWMEDDMWTAPVATKKGSILDSLSQEVFDDYRHDDDAH